MNVAAVNDPPLFNLGADQFSAEDDGPQTATGLVSGFRPGPSTATDESGQTLQSVNVTQIGSTGGLTFTQPPSIDTNGILTYTVAPDSNGSGVFSVTVTDSGGATSQGLSFILTVAAVNDPPSFTAGPDQEVPRGTTTQTVSGWATGISPGPADEAGQSLTFTVTVDNPDLFMVQPEVDPLTGDLTYTAADFVYGTATVTVVLNDDAGGDDTSAPQTFTITVNKHLLESRAVSQNEMPVFAVGAGAGGPGSVTLYNADGSPAYSVSPLADGNGARPVVADVTGDDIPDLVVGSGPGVASQVVVIDGTSKSVVQTFTPFETSFLGGVLVAAGDVNGDGLADVAVSADTLGGPRVIVYDGATGQVLADFLGIDDVNFRGGARVAFGDVNADGLADLVVTAGPGGGPRVAVFDGASIRTGTAPQRLVSDFLVFETELRDGAFATAGDLNGDGFDDLIFTAGEGGSPRVLGLDGKSLFGTPGGQFLVLMNFFAADENLRDGARLAAKDLNGDRLADVVTVIPTRPGSSVEIRLGADLAVGDTDPTTDLNLFPDVLSAVFVG